MCRSWILRRVVWTAEYIYIARTGEDAIIDSIPFAEAEKISATQTSYNEVNPDQSQNMDVMLDLKASPAEQKTRIGMASSRRIYDERDVSDVISKTSSMNIQQPVRKAKSMSGSSLVSRRFSSITRQEPISENSSTKDNKAVLRISTVAEGFNSGTPLAFVNSLSCRNRKPLLYRKDILFQDTFHGSLSRNGIGFHQTCQACKEDCRSQVPLRAKPGARGFDLQLRSFPVHGGCPHLRGAPSQSPSRPISTRLSSCSRASHHTLPSVAPAELRRQRRASPAERATRPGGRQLHPGRTFP
jgi:hypothetical protein